MTAPIFRTPEMATMMANTLYRGVFAQSPNPYLLLTVDLKIINGNDAYLSATGADRDALANTHIFDAFPDNPDDPNADGVANLTASFLLAQQSQSRHTMVGQRYDVRNRNGIWEVRYWNVINWPIIDDNGTMLALVHHVREVPPLPALLNEVTRMRKIAENLHEIAQTTTERTRKLSAAALQHLRLWSPDGEPQ